MAHLRLFPVAHKLGFGINNSVDINCDSSLLFVTDYESYSYEEVSDGRAITAGVFRIESNGALTHVGDTPPIKGFGYATGNLYLSPDGRTLFVSDTSFFSCSSRFFRAVFRGSWCAPLWYQDIACPAIAGAGGM